MATVQQLGDNRPDGSTLGASATSLLSAYGATPVAQAAYAGTFNSGETTSLSVKLNAIVSCLTNFGLMAKS